MNVVKINAAYAVKANDDAVIVDASAGGVTVTIPGARRDGAPVRVKRDTNDHSTNAIEVTTDDPDNIQFDVDGDNGLNIGPNAFYDFVKLGNAVYVF